MSQLEVTLLLEQYEEIIQGIGDINQSLDSILLLLEGINQSLVNVVYIAVALLVWKVISVIYRLFNDIMR